MDPYFRGEVRRVILKEVKRRSIQTSKRGKR